MGIIFSENIIIQFFDNQKIYKPKIRKIKIMMDLTIFLFFGINYLSY